MKKCVFAGTFDPPTKGHEQVVKAALGIFDAVTVAVMVNTGKTCALSTDERVTLLKKLFGGEPRVKVVSFEGAAVDLLKKEGTPYYVRGVRNTIDFEYEKSDFFASKKLMPELVGIFIPSAQEDEHISSTLVRNSVRFEKDYADYIPEVILSDVRKILESKYV